MSFYKKLVFIFVLIFNFFLFANNEISEELILDTSLIQNTPIEDLTLLLRDSILDTLNTLKSWTISGIVIDAQTGESANDTTIKISLLNKFYNLDSTDEFSIKIDSIGDYTLSITSLLYNDIHKTISLDSTKYSIFITIRLEKKKSNNLKENLEKRKTKGAAWKIKGFIVDDRSELAIKGAILFVDSIKVMVSAKGGFAFITKWSGLHSFKVNTHGYKNFTKSELITDNNLAPFIVLRLTKKGLAPNKRELVVSASKGDIHQTARLGKITIKRKEILNTAASLGDPMRVLQTLPGVSSTSDLNARPVVRGGDIMESRIDLDGIALLQPYHFGGFKSIFNAMAIDKMVFHRDNIPAEYHNALSSVTSIKTRNVLKKDKLALEFDVNMLQYSAYFALPIIKDKLGFYIASQGSYFDWTMKQIMGIAGENRKEMAYFSFPDYKDLSAGMVYKINETTSFFINAMINTDKAMSLEPESLFTIEKIWENGRIDTTIEVNNGFDGYYEDYYWDGYYDSQGNWIDLDTTRILKKEFNIDTNFIYAQQYDFLSGTLKKQLDDDLIINSTIAWQKRRWDLIFPNFYGDVKTYIYDVKLDQYNFHLQGLYSGKKDHLFKGGIQIDYTKQEYNVEIDRITHEMIVRGSSNYGDYFGPITGDSGFSSKEIITELEDQFGSLSLYNRFEPQITVKYKGKNEYANLSAYASNSWNVDEKLNLDAGLRFELSLIDTTYLISPRLLGKYSYNKKNEFMASICNYTQNNYEFAEIALSENIKPEGVWHFSAGWKQELLPWLKHEVTLYHKEYYNLLAEEIVAIPLNDSSAFEMLVDYITNGMYYGDGDFNSRDSLRILAEDYINDLKTTDLESYNNFIDIIKLNESSYKSVYNNSGSGFARGIEYFIKYEPADWWNGWLSVSLSESQRTRKEGYRSHPFPLERPLLISFVNYYRLKRNYEIAVKFRYMSGTPYTSFSNNDFIEIGPYNNKRFAPYMRSDFRISKSFSMFGAKASWYTELWNAFNTPNIFLRDNITRDIKTFNLDIPVPILFLGFKLDL